MSHMIKVVLVAVACTATACSPYVYKDEINSFASGVDNLSDAVKAGTKGVAEDHQSLQRLKWAKSRAMIALTIACSPGEQPAQNTGARAAESVCTIHEAAKPVPKRTAIETKAGVLVKGLQEYAAALAAVTNAADRQALDDAASSLGQSISTIVTAVGADTGSAGAVGDLVAFGLGTALDFERFRVLRKRTAEAQAPLSELGKRLGTALDAIRDARVAELAEVAQMMATSLQAMPDQASYAERLAALQATTVAIQALRVSNPINAAQDMVKAHDKLVTALADEKRQVAAVGAAIKEFVEKAKALRAAMTAGTTS